MNFYAIAAVVGLALLVGGSAAASPGSGQSPKPGSSNKTRLWQQLEAIPQLDDDQRLFLTLVAHGESGYSPRAFNDSAGEAAASRKACERMMEEHKLDEACAYTCAQLGTGSGGRFGRLVAYFVRDMRHVAKCVQPEAIADGKSDIISAIANAHALQGYDSWNGMVSGLRGGWGTPNWLDNPPADKVAKWGRHAEEASIRGGREFLNVKLRRFPGPEQLPAIKAALDAFDLNGPAGPKPDPNQGERPCVATSFGTLGFRQVMTGGASSGDDVPVHVFLHGRGVTPKAMEKYVSDFSLPARHIVLEGPTKVGSGRAWTQSRCADVDQDKLAAQMSWSGERIAKAIEEIVACYGRPVVLSGFSNGGSMAYLLATMAVPGLVGVVAQAGCLPASLQAATRGTVGIHGANDDTVPIGPTEAFARANGVDFRVVADGHSPNASTLSLWRQEVSKKLQA